MYLLVFNQFLFSCISPLMFFQILRINNCVWERLLSVSGSRAKIVIPPSKDKTPMITKGRLANQRLPKLTT